MIRAHRKAVVDALETVLPGSVFTSYAATRGERYAVVFFTRSAKRVSRFTGAQDTDVFTVTVHSVGVSEDSALWVQEKVDQLTGRVLTVPNRRLRRVRYVNGQECKLADGMPEPLWFTVSQFQIISDPA